jgi:hypothetical protein
MFPVLVSPDITTFVGAQRSGVFFEGVVSVLQGPRSSRQQLVCLGVRDTEVEALRDAERDAAALIELWRQKVPLRDGRSR